MRHITKPTWQAIAALGRLKAVKTSFFWLVAVPPVAKMLSTLERTLHFVVGEQQLTVVLELPFSWKVFYTSSLFIALATLLYLVRCPKLIREHPTWDSFSMAGKDFRHLYSYATEIDAHMPPAPNDDMFPLEQLADIRRQHYWMLHDSADHARQYSRWAAAILYAIGLLLIGWVALENVYYVLRVLLT